MTAFTPFSEAQFQQLAMGKARGFTWTMMADELSLPLDVVERVPWTHEKLWNRHLAKAERLVAREAIAEVVGTLRRDLRNAEPPLHATLANSMTRLLQLQQDFAPQRRRLPNGPPNPVPNPVPNGPPNLVPTPSEVVAAPVVPPPVAKAPLGPLPSLQGTVSALLGLFMLVCALAMGCWNSPRPAHLEPVVLLETPPAAPLDEAPETRPTIRVVLTPPPWVRESERPRHHT